MDFLQALQTNAQMVCQKLENICAGLSDSTVNKAVRYSLLGGGKRLRACLVIESARLLGATHDDENVMLMAAAIEMIHAYSLVHDDLPAMDNDDFRRGKPACHRVFGDGIAILAGDALLNLAFETLLSGKFSKSYVDAVKFIAACSGTFGMIDGQSFDIDGSAKNDLPALLNIAQQKTGKLLVASAAATGIYLNSPDEKIIALKKFAEHFGLAFQIADDMLDTKTDAEANFCNLLGQEKAEALLTKSTHSAVEALSMFGEAAWFFRALAEFNVSRNR